MKPQAPPDDFAGWRTRGARLAVALVLTIVSAPLRLHDLGAPGLVGDEEYTVLAARSLLDGDGARMPSGMPYLRGLPFTGAAAAAAAALGEDDLAAYRLPSALLGAVTPAALYLTGSALVSPPAALVAASMLSLSAWHLRFSRIARMYVPFTLLFLIAGHFLWRWAVTGRTGLLVAGTLAYAATLSLHLLGVAAAQFALIPVALGAAAVSPLVAVPVAALLGGVGYQAVEALVHRPYGIWSLPGEIPIDGFLPPVGVLAASPSWNPWLLAVGLALGSWLGVRLGASDDERSGGATGERLGRGLAALAAGAALGTFAAGGYLWGATLSGAVLLLVSPRPLRGLVTRGGAPLLGVALLGAGWAVYAFGYLGPEQGLRRLAMFPFPYLHRLWEVSPALVLLFVAATLWVALARGGDEAPGVRGAALAVLLPLGALGMASSWGPARYLLMVYPYMLLCAAAIMLAMARWLTGRVRQLDHPLAAPVLVLVAVAAGAVPPHGVRDALDGAATGYGRTLDAAVHESPYPVDHEVPGRFVRDRLTPGDVVIAEDVSMQIVYAGRADYWFRRAGDARNFLYLDAGGVPRDMYAGARLLGTIAALDEVVARAQGRVWFITSGETAWISAWYHSPEQAAWLDLVKRTHTPEVVGRDGVTAVYCLNC